MIKLCGQAALRIKLVRLIKKYDERKELRDRMREKLTQLCNSENLGAEDRRRMPDFDLSDIHTDMRHTLDRMREGCQHLMHESMADIFFDHIYAEGGCEHLLRRINGTLGQYQRGATVCTFCLAPAWEWFGDPVQNFRCRFIMTDGEGMQGREQL